MEVDNQTVTDGASLLPQEPKSFPLPQINPLPGEETPEDLQQQTETAQPEQQEETPDITADMFMNQDTQNEEKDETEDTVKEGTELYCVRKQTSFEFEPIKQMIDGTEKTGVWMYLTTKTTEKIVIEEWEDRFVYKYTLSEDLDVPDEQRKATDQCLYKELSINPEEDIQLFILEDDIPKLKLEDHYLVKHEYVAKSLGIDIRRFAVIDHGEIVCSADKSVIKTLRPENNEAGCFVYVTTILPEESVLQDWEDKTLNVYYFNEPMILPYGADNEPDPFFDDIYIDKIENADGSEDRIFSYYDDNVMGEYLKNEPKTAEIFLIEADLKKLSYYGSYDLKLDNVKFIHHIDKPMYE